MAVIYVLSGGMIGVGMTVSLTTNNVDVVGVALLGVIMCVVAAITDHFGMMDK